MITHTHRPLRVVLYEGDGSIPLPPEARTLVMASLLDKGYAVTRVTPGRGASLVDDDHTLLVLGLFADGAPQVEVAEARRTVEARDLAANQLALGILGTPSGRFIKILIMVDEDIDVFRPEDVQWALATRVQPDRDVQILREMTGILIDPSIDPADRAAGWAKTSKMIIDATRYHAKDFEPVVRPKPDVMAMVEKNWASYGIKL